MVIPVDGDGRVALDPEEEFWKANSRQAGGQQKQRGSFKILVDLREFRSSLPSLIHSKRMQVIPCTLSIGDYILSPKLCVERKSISDLTQSLKSGRLFTQCESMKAHYQKSILLIEFEQSRSFRLIHSKVDYSKIDDYDICTRLTLLLVHFPKLHIIWSVGAHATADIFKDLKEEESEPVLADAVALEQDSTAAQSAYNGTPSSILQSLPGINFKNYKRVMDSAKNLKELSEFCLLQMNALIGEENGRQLFNFFHKVQKVA
jgi:DNA excision repair protein ERCC-4